MHVVGAGRSADRPPVLLRRGRQPWGDHPVVRAEGGDAGQDALVPAGYAMTGFGDFRIGVGVNAPFGLVTSYDDEWIAATRRSPPP